METIIAQIVTEMVNNIFDHIKKVGISNLSIMGTALQQDANTCMLKILKAIIEKTDSLLLENKKLRKIDRLTVQQRNKKVTMQHYLQVPNNFSRLFLSLHLYSLLFLPPPTTPFLLHTNIHLLCVP